MKTKIFLDSGAYTALTKKVIVNLEDYIKFIKNNHQYLETYTNLDDINSSEITLSNQKTMEAEGLNPLPVFHYGEDYKYLEYYLENYDYLALGGLVGGMKKDLYPWLDTCWSIICLPPNYIPTHKIHGFGMTSPELIARYPWFSADSSSWVQYGKYGMILIPQKVRGNNCFSIPPWRLFVSTRSTKLSKEGTIHFNNLTKQYKTLAYEYISSKGFVLGSSEFKKVHNLYKLKPNEQWADMKERIVEVIIEKGLSNNHELRDRFNLQFFLDLEASVPKWPWAWRKSGSISGW